jgi:phosphotransferase system HPr-like phosphotransfer protein
LEPKSLVQIISEDEFLPLVEEAGMQFFQTFNSFAALPDISRESNRKCYSNLIQQAELLESFMDEYGARQNKTWTFFTEYVASIRNLVIAAFYIKHLVDRYPFYNLRDSKTQTESFYKESQDALDFLNQSILNLYQECLRACEKNNLQYSKEAVNPSQFAEVEINKQLPKNAEDEQVKEDEERIIDMFEKMGNVAAMMEDMNARVQQRKGELKRIVPEVIDEKKARMVMSLAHSVQSEFDTYIKGTNIQKKHEKLKDFRGYISMPLHLLEVTIWLTHFYERHEDEIRQGECKRVIATLVNKDALLKHVVGFCFKHCIFYIREGDLLGKELLKEFVKTVRYELSIPTPLGFHARPSTYISLIVRKHDAEAFLIVDEEKFNARSVMSLLQAGGAVADKGYQKVVFEGDKRVLDDLRILAEHNYCEDTNIPPELSYLKSMRESA